MQTTYSKINNICLIILTAIAITIALIYTKIILVPFVIALFIYSVLTPVIKWLKAKLKLPTLISLAVIVIFLLLMSALLLIFISSSFESFFKSSHIYRDEVINFVTWLSQFLSKWDININDASIQQAFKDLPVFTVAKDITGSVFGFIGNTILILIFVLFLIAGEIRDTSSNPIISEIQYKISKYIITKFFISILTGITIGLILGIAGVKLAIMFAILTVLLNFIPNIGSLIAIVLPLPIVLLQFGIGWKSLIILVLTSITQFSIGNIIEPKIMGENMDLHPITILIFLMFWGLVWGIPGMFLAVPITAILKIILNKIETTKPLAEIFAGRLPE